MYLKTAVVMLGVKVEGEWIDALRGKCVDVLTDRTILSLVCVRILFIYVRKQLG
jgi:hypothetical protein